MTSAKSIFLTLIALFTTTNAWALGGGRFDIPLSLSYGIGQIENPNMKLDARKMDALSFEALPSYVMGEEGQWLLGLHIDLRRQGQLDAAEDYGNSNLRGEGYLIGIGLRRDFTKRFFAQGSFDFLGEYKFTQDTIAAQSHKAASPLGLRLKSGYAFLEKIPNLTADLDLLYVEFKDSVRNGSAFSDKTKLWIASVGVTYRFGGQEKPVETPPEPVTPIKEEPATIAQIEGIQKVEGGLKLDLPSETFASGSAELNEDAKATLAKNAQLIANSPNTKVRIEGHTDSTGKLASNMKLSDARAKAVRDVLVENGVRAENITTKGWGPQKPIADNKTSEGKAKNRRVEIILAD